MLRMFGIWGRRRASNLKCGMRVFDIVYNRCIEGFIENLKCKCMKSTERYLFCTIMF